MAVQVEVAIGLGPRWTHLFRSVIVPCPRYTRGDRVYRCATARRKNVLALSTVYYGLFGGNSVLESFINLRLNASLSLLLLRTVSSDDSLSLGKVGSDGLSTGAIRCE